MVECASVCVCSLGGGGNGSMWRRGGGGGGVKCKFKTLKYTNL